MSGVVYPYLGVPGSMVQLPGPSGPVDFSPSRGDVLHTDLAGGVGVTRRLAAKRTFTLPYTSRPGTGTDDLLLGFYQGLHGDGPFVFVDPSVTNVLGLDVSTCGLRSNAALNLIQSTGTLTRSATGGPAGVQSGVVSWGSLAANATLGIGTVVDVANMAAAPVYLPGEAVTVSMYLKASAATTATMRISGYDVNGNRQSLSSVSGSVSITTAWQRFSVSAAAGNSTLASMYYVLPWLLLGASVPTTVSVAGMQLEYATAASPWSPGAGSPRVLITSTPGRALDRFDDYSTHTLSLGEVG